MNNYWETTVNELVAIFRNSVIAIIPLLEQAKIKWKEGESYDDWDNIVTTLFENIVCSSLFSEVSLENDMSKYDMVYKNYSNMNFLIVKSTENINKTLAFISFQSLSTPLDSVKVAVLNNQYNVIDYLILKSENLDYFFVKNHNGKYDIISEIKVL